MEDALGGFPLEDFIITDQSFFLTRKKEASLIFRKALYFKSVERR